MGTATSPNNLLPSVAYISNKIYPHHNTDTQQVIKNASALHDAGLSVELLIPLQLKHTGASHGVIQKEIYQYYNVSKGLKIKELWGVPAGWFSLEKFFHALISCLYVAFNKQYDLIYTRDKITALMAYLFGQKVVFETYRRYGDEFPGLMGWLARRVKKDNFLGMVLHSNMAAASMLRAGFPEEKLLVLHNGYDDSDMKPALSKEESRKQLGLSDQAKYVTYTGNMQKNKCIESLIDIAPNVPDAQFLLVGGTPEDVERLKAYAATKGVNNIILTGHRPIAEVSLYLYAADVLIIPPVSAPLEKFGRTVLPFKTFPYLAASRPIIAPDAPDVRELLVHGHNAMLVEPDNTLQNARALMDLLADDDLQHTLSFHAASLAKLLTWEERAAKLVAWLKVKTAPNPSEIYHYSNT